MSRILVLIAFAGLAGGALWLGRAPAEGGEPWTKQAILTGSEPVVELAGRPSLSADGRFLVHGQFEPADQGFNAALILRDLQTGMAARITETTGRLKSSSSRPAVISADGSTVAYLESDYVPGSAIGPSTELVFYDRASGARSRTSIPWAEDVLAVTPAGALLMIGIPPGSLTWVGRDLTKTAESFPMSVCDGLENCESYVDSVVATRDGRHVTYVQRPLCKLGATCAWFGIHPSGHAQSTVLDRKSGAARVLAAAGPNRILALSDDARYGLTSFEVDDADRFWCRNARMDLTTGAIETIGFLPDGTPGEELCVWSLFGTISADGRMVAFTARPEENTGSSIFIRDLVRGRTYLASFPVADEALLNDAALPIMSADGSRVVFQSSALNLIGDDGDNVNDLFLADVLHAGRERFSLFAPAASRR